MSAPPVMGLLSLGMSGWVACCSHQQPLGAQAGHVGLASGSNRFRST
ncbi:hypothetical protein HaLaN_01098, partial [Haematococcus lacustris]